MKLWSIISWITLCISLLLWSNHESESASSKNSHHWWKKGVDFSLNHQSLLNNARGSILHSRQLSKPPEISNCLMIWAVANLQISSAKGAKINIGLISSIATGCRNYCSEWHNYCYRLPELLFWMVQLIGIIGQSCRNTTFTVSWEW